MAYSTIITRHVPKPRAIPTTTTMHRQRARAKDRAPGLEQAPPFYPLPIYPTYGREHTGLRSSARHVKQHSPAVCLALLAVVGTYVSLTY